MTEQQLGQGRPYSEGRDRRRVARQDAAEREAAMRELARSYEEARLAATERLRARSRTSNGQSSGAGAGGEPVDLVWLGLGGFDGCGFGF